MTISVEGDKIAEKHVFPEKNNQEEIVSIQRNGDQLDLVISFLTVEIEMFHFYL